MKLGLWLGLRKAKVREHEVQLPVYCSQPRIRDLGLLLEQAYGLLHFEHAHYLGPPTSFRSLL